MVSRGRFARMCIEVNITKPLLSKFKLRRRVRCIEYEGIHLICFKCGVYGHRAEQCHHNEENGKQPENAKQPATGEQGGDRVAIPQNRKYQFGEDMLIIWPEITETYGPWMLAPKKS